MHRYPFNIPDDMMKKLRALSKKKERSMRALLLKALEWVLKDEK